MWLSFLFHGALAFLLIFPRVFTRESFNEDNVTAFSRAVLEVHSESKSKLGLLDIILNDENQVIMDEVKDINLSVLDLTEKDKVTFF